MKKERSIKPFHAVSVRVRNQDLTGPQEHQARAEFSLLLRSHNLAPDLTLVQLVEEAERNNWKAELARLDIAIPRIRKQL